MHVKDKEKKKPNIVGCAKKLTWVKTQTLCKHIQKNNSPPPSKTPKKQTKNSLSTGLGSLENLLVLVCCLTFSRPIIFFYVIKAVLVSPIIIHEDWLVTTVKSLGIPEQHISLRS